MNKKNLWKNLVFASVLIPNAGFSADEKSEELKFGGSLDIQAQKNFYEDEISKNLEGLFGRINLGVSKSNEEMEGKIALRAYPAGFGYEPVIGIEVDGALQTEKIAKIQVWDAWAKTKGSLINIKLGRWAYTDSPGNIFGSYLDIDYGSNKALGRVYGVNALEVSNKSGMFETEISAITKDESLDEGEFRGSQKILLTPHILIMLTYKSNIWNRVRDSDANHSQNWDFQFRFKVNQDIQSFVEVAGKENTNGYTEYPILIGSSLPSWGVLDKLTLEAEIVDASSGTRKENPILWGLSAVKNISDDYKAQVAIFSAEKPSEVSVVSRLTVGF